MYLFFLSKALFYPMNIKGKDYAFLMCWIRAAS